MSRIHYMDALRGTAMLLGIVFHSLLFLVPYDAWPVHDAWAHATDPRQNPYALAISGLHGFRMPLFFVISGFFTAMMWRSRGIRRVLRHRLVRIGVPLLAGMVTIVQVTNWLFSGQAFPLLSWPLAWVDGLAHLWFLWHLLLMTGGLAIALRLRLEFRRRAWWVLVPLALVPQFLMQERLAFGADYSVGLLPVPRVFVYYTIFFLFGVFFYQNNIEIKRRWTLALLPAVLAALPAGMMLMHDERFRQFEASWIWAAASVLQITYVWLMCFSLIALFRWIAARERFWVRYLSDSSYWLYLAHVPLVIGAQMAVVPWQVSVHLKVVAVLAAVTCCLLVSYQLAVRYTVIGTVLNGPRTRRSRAGVAPVAG